MMNSNHGPFDALAEEASLASSSTVSKANSQTITEELSAIQKKFEYHHLPQQYEIDYVGTGTFQVSQLNLFNKRSSEVYKHPESILSARGLQHRSKDIFVKEVQTQSNLIVGLKRSEKRTGGKYKPSPQLFQPHFQRALAYERINLIDKAIKDYTFCILTDENSAAAYFNRGGLYKIKKEHDKAIADMNKAIALEPANVNYRTSRSMLFRENSLYVEAVQDVLITRAIQRQPNIAKTLEAGGDVKLDGDLQYASKIAEDPILVALRKPCHLRSDSDLEPILDFLRNVKFFAAFASNRYVLSRIASKVEFVERDKGQHIFEQGDPGHHLFVILDGEVSIIKVKYTYTIANVDPIVETTTLVRLYRGHHFGETALESAGGLRSAGAVATQPSKLVLLPAKDYQKVMSQFRSALQEEVRLALRSSPIFQDWEEQKIHQLASFAMVKSYGTNSEILKSGEPVNQLMMVKSGVVKLLKATPRPKTHGVAALARAQMNSNQFEPTPETVGLWVLEKSSRQRIPETASPKKPLPAITTTTTNTNTNNNSSAGLSTSFGSTEDDVELTVGVLGSGQVFGELAVLDPGQASGVSAVSFTTVELYCFDSDLLLSLDIKFNAGTINKLDESLTLHDPPAEKMEYYFRSKFAWELRKMKLISKLTK